MGVKKITNAVIVITKRVMTIEKAKIFNLESLKETLSS